MRPLPDSPAPRLSHTDTRRALARRVADAHLGIDDASLLALVSGSVVDDITDARSDVDMSVVLRELPEPAVLEAACQHGGGTRWNWTLGSLEEGLVVSFKLEGIEIQIAYATHALLQSQLNEVLVAHNPDTPLHKLAEGLLKAEGLIGVPALQALQARLAAFPPELGRAMVEHGLKTATPWRAISQIIDRDTPLWCRELQVDASYRLLLMLCGLNSRYFTRFQVKRVSRLADKLVHVPAALAPRIESMLAAPPAEAFVQLHALEGEVLALVAARMPEVDLAPALQRRQDFNPG